MPQIVYEDNHLLVVVKPPNCLTQSDCTGDVSLQDECKAWVKKEYQKPGEVYLGLVHRLDRPVGGLVAFARTSKAAARLSEQLRNRTMHREYLCVVEKGVTLPKEGEIHSYLQKDEAGGNVVCKPSPEGAMEAALNYRVLSRREGTALLHIQLQTGRKHQIRVQFASIGHSICYDMRYGHGQPGKNISLWGAYLRLEHPTQRVPMYFTSEPQGGNFNLYQAEIKQWLAAYRQQEENI